MLQVRLSHLDLHLASLPHDVSKLGCRQSGEHRLTQLDVHSCNSATLS